MDGVRTTIKKMMRSIAVVVDKVFSGKVGPNEVTVISVWLHLIILVLLLFGELKVAAVLIIVFGLMDSLDGELARLQNKVSDSGMVLDAVSDRMKEAFIYVGLAHYLADNQQTLPVMILVAALSGSILVSYVKAKGETVLAKNPDKTTAEINRTFQDGLMRYEVRTVILAIGVFTSQLTISLSIIALLSWYTAFVRLQTVLRQVSKKV